MANFVSIESKPGEGASTAPLQPAAAPASSGNPAGSPAAGVQVTDRAVKRIRIAMAKEGISPEEGGLRLGILGGGCSGLSYSIKFDTHPREARSYLRVRRGSRLRRSQVVHLLARHDAGLRRDTDAAGLQFHQSELHALLRLRLIILVVGFSSVGVFPC